MTAHTRPPVLTHGQADQARTLWLKGFCTRTCDGRQYCSYADDDAPSTPGDIASALPK
jgi:hypothetical protein